MIDGHFVTPHKRLCNKKQNNIKFTLGKKSKVFLISTESTMHTFKLLIHPSATYSFNIVSLPKKSFAIPDLKNEIKYAWSMALIDSAEDTHEPECSRKAWIEDEWVDGLGVNWIGKVPNNRDINSDTLKKKKKELSQILT